MLSNIIRTVLAISSESDYWIHRLKKKRLLDTCHNKFTTLENIAYQLQFSIYNHSIATLVKLDLCHVIHLIHVLNLFCVIFFFLYSCQSSLNHRPKSQQPKLQIPQIPAVAMRGLATTMTLAPTCVLSELIQHRWR